MQGGGGRWEEGEMKGGGREEGGGRKEEGGGKREGGGRMEEVGRKREEGKCEERRKEDRRGGIILDEPLGAARLSLVRTFYLILKKNRGKLLEEVPDCCWHALMVWFFEKK